MHVVRLQASYLYSITLFFKSQMLREGQTILSDVFKPLLSEYELLPSGQYRAQARGTFSMLGIPDMKSLCYCGCVWLCVVAFCCYHCLSV